MGNAKEQSKKSSAMFSKMTKALDGDYSEEQARRLQEEREYKKPGQVMSIAEHEAAMEKAMEMAKADLENIQKAKGLEAPSLAFESVRRACHTGELPKEHAP